jgi:glycine oxidase
MAQTYDAIIVGAGIIGLSIGWRSRQLGLSILVVDAGRAGAASSVAAGMLAPVTEATFGEDDLLRLSLDSAARYPSFLEDLSESSEMEVSSHAGGTIFVALDRDQTEELRRLFEFQTSLGLSVEWLGSEECRNLEGALHPSVRTGILARSDREIDPRELLLALEAALLRAGGEIRRGAEVGSILIVDDKTQGVRLIGGEELRAESVVIAAGCWSGAIERLPREIVEAIRPVKGQILRLRPRHAEPPLTSHVLRTEDVYVVPRRDASLVVGATVEEQGFDTQITAGGVFELLRAADELIPGVRELELVATEAGLRPGTPDNSPLLGPTSTEGLIAAAGHYRNGVLLTPVTADSIAAVLAKDEVPEEIKPFAPSRFVR